MSGFASVGDLARGLELRRAAADLRPRLETLSRELATGRRADPAATERGNLGPLAALASEAARLSGHLAVAGEVALRLEVQDLALSRMTALTEEASLVLLNADLAPPAAPGSARARFEDMVDRLNTASAGRFVFGGPHPRIAPLRPAGDILAAAADAMQAAPDADAGVAAVRALFAPPPHDAGTVLATPGGAPVAAPVGSGRPVLLPDIVRHTATGDALAGLALAALAEMTVDDGGSPGFPAGAGAASRQAALELLLPATTGLVALRGTVGDVTFRVDTARAAASAGLGAIERAEAERLGADPYATATALRDTESLIETIHLLTARLARLSLADYLR